jgi:hypothetical protein
MIEALVQIAKIVIAFFGEVLLWIVNAFLWLAAAAEGIDNLLTALVLLAVVVFAPGLWLAKHLREKEEKARTAAELQRAWEVSHELTPEEQEALRFVDDPGDPPKAQPPDEFQELRDCLSAMRQKLRDGERK